MIPSLVLDSGDGRTYAAPSVPMAPASGRKGAVLSGSGGGTAEPEHGHS
jgi:hypothetical protein